MPKDIFDKKFGKKSDQNKANKDGRSKESPLFNHHSDDWQPIEWTITKTNVLDRYQIEKALKQQRKKESPDTDDPLENKQQHRPSLNIKWDNNGKEDTWFAKNLPKNTAAKTPEEINFSPPSSVTENLDPPINIKEDTPYGRAYANIKRLENTFIGQTNFDILNIQKEKKPRPDDHIHKESLEQTPLEQEPKKAGGNQQSLFLSEAPVPKPLINPLENITYSRASTNTKKLENTLLGESLLLNSDQEASDSLKIPTSSPSSSLEGKAELIRPEKKKPHPKDHFLVTTKTRKPAKRTKNLPKKTSGQLSSTRRDFYSINLSLPPFSLMAISLAVFFAAVIALGLICSLIAYVAQLDIQSLVALPLTIFLLASIVSSFTLTRINNKKPSPVQIVIIIAIANVISLLIAGFADISWLGVIIKLISSMAVALAAYYLTKVKFKKRRAY
ncbi:MAG: hypothetical protein ACOX7H_06310 [Bacillota bacterium]